MTIRRGGLTADYAALGDGSVTTRIAATDLVIVRMGGPTGRPQICHLARQDTGEALYDAATAAYIFTGVVPSTFIQDAAVLVERPAGRAAVTRRLVSIANIGV